MPKLWVFIISLCTLSTEFLWAYSKAYSHLNKVVVDCAVCGWILDTAGTRTWYKPESDTVIC